MNILVTGGAGFIGSHIVDRLIADRHTVRVLDNLEDQVHGGVKPAYWNQQAEYVIADIRNREAVKQALKEIDVVYHEASAVGVGQSMYKIHDYVDSNCSGTAQLLDVIVNEKIRLKKLIIASSMSIYGEGLYHCNECGDIYPPLRSDEQLRARQWEPICPNCNALLTAAVTPETKPLSPTSVYAISKRDQEELCLAVGAAYGIPTVALRYFNVYGPRQSLSNPYTGVCAIFSARIKNNHAPIIYENGAQSRDFIDVRDIVEANILALHCDAMNHKVFNVGSGQATSIAEIAALLNVLYKKDCSPRIDSQFRSGDIRHCYADISQIRTCGFEPRIKLEDGLRDLVAWADGAQAVDTVENAHNELRDRGLIKS